MNYLRVRGEYQTFQMINHIQVELPPRARRILSDYVDEPELIGTTSACAENTQRRMADASDVGNYLRVRGEYGTLAATAANLGELPPRARRIRFKLSPPVFFFGTTSACAENTVGHGRW